MRTVSSPNCVKFTGPIPAAGFQIKWAGHIGEKKEQRYSQGAVSHVEQVSALEVRRLVNLAVTLLFTCVSICLSSIQHQAPTLGRESACRHWGRG